MVPSRSSRWRSRRRRPTVRSRASWASTRSRRKSAWASARPWPAPSAPSGGLLQVFSPEGLGRFFPSVGDEGPRDLESPTSLVGIGQAVNAFGNAGDLFAVIVVLAQLSIVLGVLNMLPLPPLDGGHVAVLAVEEGVNAVRARRGRSQGEAPDEGRERWTVDPSVLTPIALAVILFFVVLSFTALYLDLTKPITDALQ